MRPSLSPDDHSKRPPRLDLRLTVQFGPEGPVLDIEVDAYGVQPLGAMIAAAAEIAGVAVPHAAVWCARQGGALPLDLPLAEARLRHGDVLQTGEPRPGAPRVRARRTAAVEALVTAGPDAGARHGLADGEHTIGRDAGCDVVIEDPSMSRRHLLVQVIGGAVRVKDLKSYNGTFIGDDHVAADRWTVVRPGEQVEAGRTLLGFEGAGGTRLDLGQRGGAVPFNRPPRVRLNWQPLSAEIPGPPDPPSRPRLPLVASLVPLIGGIAMFLLFKNPALLLFTALTPMMAVGTFVSDRRAAAKSKRGREGRWRAQADETLARVGQAHEAEIQARRQEAPDVGELTARALRCKPALWERRAGDADALHLRVGVADQPTRNAVKLGRGGPDGLRGEVEESLRRYALVSAVPVVVDGTAGPIGLCGAHARVIGQARWLVLQAATLHAPGELIVCAALPEQPEGWEWLTWLPHTAAARAPWGARPLARGTQQAERLLADLALWQEGRIAERAERIGAQLSGPRVLLVVDESLGLERSRIAPILDRARESGIAVVWAGHDRHALPGQCATIVEHAEGRAVAQVTDVATGAVIGDASADGVAAELAEEVARALAPIVEEGARGGPGVVPSRVALLPLLDLDDPDADAVAARWSRSDGTLRGIVGASADGPFSVDLLTQGPHALVIGGTESGKSEFLRALVSSIAADHPPTHVTFLLADYKGGSAFRPCAAFPHVIQVLTDLDARTAARALVSIGAEMTRRERLLEDFKARDLAELRRRGGEDVPPLLVVMVDEFAKVDEEVPGFVDGMVDLARRGRALGVHLVLSSQTLDHSFAKGIRANVAVRVALRVQGDDDSEAVIGSRAAARIPSTRTSRGRAFARLGPGSLTEFQTAYASGQARAGNAPPLIVRRFGLLAGEEAPRAAFAESDEQDSDLAVLARACAGAAERSGLAAPRALWHPELEPVLDLARVPPAELSVADGPAARVAVGIVDAPERQCQEPLLLDLAMAGNALALGGGGSGRTTFLRTVAAALAERCSPSEVHIYGIDGGQRGLAALDELPHCGGVIAAEDLERFEILLRRLVREIERRARDGVQLAPQGADARIVILLDDLASVSAAVSGSFLEHEALLGRVMAAGRAHGVHVVATADRRAAVPAALASTIGWRVALRVRSAEEAYALGVEPGAAIGEASPPGRGLTVAGEEMQIAVPDGEGTPEGQASALARRAEAHAPSARGPVRVEALPDDIGRDRLPQAEGAHHVPLGVGGLDRDPVSIVLTDRHFLIAGPLHSGRTTTMLSMARGLMDAVAPPSLWLLTQRRSPLAALEGWEVAASGSTLRDATERLGTLVAQRMADDSSTPPVVVLIDDAHEIGDLAVQGALERIVRFGRDVGVTVVAATEPGAARGIMLPWLKELRGDAYGLLLRPAAADVGELLTVSLPPRFSTSLPPGRGFLASGGAWTLVQVAQDRGRETSVPARFAAQDS